LEAVQPFAETLQRHFPELRFHPGQSFYWSPDTEKVVYNQAAKGHKATWSLLHETSHALLGHRSYKNDFELIEMEVAAWERAKELATELKLAAIEEDHVQDCLDTYRDWLYRRCICPACGTKSLQESARRYSCFNCGTRWHVTPSRFCRAYRTKIA
jgi:hypothetical protein